MSPPRQLGRYSLFGELASGGMATVYLARLNGEVGFGRTVAIKRLHPHLAREREFVTMFVDEAHLAARIRHPNVAQTLDIVTRDEELFLVMEYIEGESLVALLRRATELRAIVPVPVAVAIAIGLLNGLHAAHEATDEEGKPLGIIHRDVSPQNVLVGTDGVPRLVDFGIARAASRLAVSREGQVKGKLPYMAPEQLAGVNSRRTDIYAAGVVLWEGLTCRRLYRGDTEAELFGKVMAADVAPPSRYNRDVSSTLDTIVLSALAKSPDDRWPTARSMAEALDATLRPASTMQVGEWVRDLAAASLLARSALVVSAEAASDPRMAARSSGALSLRGPAEGADSLPRVADGLHTSTSTRPVAHPPSSTAPRGSGRRPGIVLGAVAVAGLALAAAVAARPTPAPSVVAASLGSPREAMPLPDALPSATGTNTAAPPSDVATALSSSSSTPKKRDKGEPPRRTTSPHPDNIDGLLDTR